MKQACIAINHFLRERFRIKHGLPSPYNASMPLHRNILNMKSTQTMLSLWEGRVWIEDENGQATTLLETKSGQKLLVERGLT